MSLNVIIKQKGLFGKKPLPLDVILGDELIYGSLEDGMTFSEEVMGDGDFIAYHPDCPGRGFSVYWKEGETDMVDISMPTPSYKPEIEAFYRMIKRITDFWKCSMTVDGNKITPDEFQKGIEETIDFNLKTVSHFSEKVLKGEFEVLTLFSALQPLMLGPKEAAEFKESPRNFGAWLYQKQTVDAAYLSPRFYQGENGKILGRYWYGDGIPCVMPLKPLVPFSAVDPQTGGKLECGDWAVVIFSKEADDPLGEIEYYRFLEKLPKYKVEYFDGGHILVQALTKDEIADILE